MKSEVDMKNCVSCVYLQVATSRSAERWGQILAIYFSLQPPFSCVCYGKMPSSLGKEDASTKTYQPNLSVWFPLSVKQQVFILINLSYSTTVGFQKPAYSLCSSRIFELSFSYQSSYVDPYVHTYARNLQAIQQWFADSRQRWRGFSEKRWERWDLTQFYKIL